MSASICFVHLCSVVWVGGHSIWLCRREDEVTFMMKEETGKIAMWTMVRIRIPRSTHSYLENHRLFHDT